MTDETNRWVDGQLRAYLGSTDPRLRRVAFEGVTDFVRIVMLETGWRELPGVSTTVTDDPGPDDPLCVVEGLVPLYAADLHGDEGVRAVLEKRVAEVMAREGRTCEKT